LFSTAINNHKKDLDLASYSKLNSVFLPGNVKLTKKLEIIGFGVSYCSKN
jgi:hypothetical protein